jgi:putative flavoprotein involved in K+ transport
MNSLMRHARRDEVVDVLVVGGGQAGIAMSEHLGHRGIPHLVLERDRIAERWRTCRWNSLVANGPAWHDRFPGLLHSGDPEGFPGKDAVADYFEAYAKKIAAPIRCGVSVASVRRNSDGPGFVVDTSEGRLIAQAVVAATGPFQRPVIPGIVPAKAGLVQIHSAAYREPGQLPPGGVLVVGSGSSGAQIAEELRRAGRRVVLSVSAHGRPPRRYRGRDFTWWLGVLNKWDIEAPPEASHVTIAVSGANGGRTVDFRQFAVDGITLTGRVAGFAEGVVTFAPDLSENLNRGDADYLAVLDEADAWVARNRADLPPEPAARIILPDPPCVTDPILSLDLHGEGITAIIWATGYARDFGWLQVHAFDTGGNPRHQRGVASEPGIYFLGLPWLARRGSAFIWGVWHDAKHIADHIAKHRAYLSYTPADHNICQPESSCPTPASASSTHATPIPNKS